MGTGMVISSTANFTLAAYACARQQKPYAFARRRHESECALSYPRRVHLVLIPKIEKVNKQACLNWIRVGKTRNLTSLYEPNRANTWSSFGLQSLDTDLAYLKFHINQ